jgi:hypothetical protein
MTAFIGPMLRQNLAHRCGQAIMSGGRSSCPAPRCRWKKDLWRKTLRVSVMVRTEELHLPDMLARPASGWRPTVVRRQVRATRATQQFVIRHHAIRKHRHTRAIANLPRNTYFEPATASVR